MKPLIGLNLDIKAGPPPTASIQATYYQAVAESGGIPILIPPMSQPDTEDLLRKMQGLVLIGGDDYSPDLYGETTHMSCSLLDPTRQEFDLRLVKTAITQTKIPILGICGGCQLLNICLGGSLIQDIKSEIPNSQVTHTNPDGWHSGFARHNVLVITPSLLQEIYATSQISITSSHHQAVKVLGSGLKATAHAEDGVIEAIELPTRPFTLGVQWHPERDLTGNQLLFRAFISRANEESYNN